MDKRLEHITPLFQGWLKELLNSDEIDLFVLHKLKKGNIVTNPFEVKIDEPRAGRRVVINKPLGFLIFEKTAVESVAAEFLSFGRDAIRNEQYSVEGLANYLILVFRLGSFTDSAQYDIIKKLCTDIPPDIYKGLLEEFIDYFNRVYKREDYNIKDTLNFKDWDDLFFGLQYLDHIGNPISLLRTIVNFNKSDISLMEVIHRLLPVPRTSLLEYGVDLTEIDEDALVEHLAKYRDESIFYGALVLYEYNAAPPFLAEKLAAFLVASNWEAVGRYLFRKIYHGHRRVINEKTKNILSGEIDNWLTEYFAMEDSPSMLDYFGWPEDYIALGGWLAHVENDNIELTLHSKIMDDLAEATSTIIGNLCRDLPKFIANVKSIHQNWISDPFDLGAVYIRTYMVYSIMTCGEEKWERIKSAFKRLFFEVKFLFYSAYVGNRLGLDISNKVLGLLLTFPRFKDGNIHGTDRLALLFKQFSITAGQQWVIFTERERMIWSFEDYKPTFGDTDLLYLIRLIKEVSPEYVEVADELKRKIQEASTVEWPI